MSQLGSNGTVGASFLTQADAAEKQLEEIREGVGDTSGVGGKGWGIFFHSWKGVVFWGESVARWWFQTFLIFTPTWGDDPI